ncbi:hypothetical protein E2C01_046624 [Portunus trituberculatus]|uniref:Uncharacterized protein n=1 Tax=Portunus trituberculatus TaxID=210409 RepID=A0A5B7G6P0_PORTR|nr:hypothetical protein [Portunus trituberculatus]
MPCWLRMSCEDSLTVQRCHTCVHRLPENQDVVQLAVRKTRELHPLSGKEIVCLQFSPPPFPFTQAAGTGDC